MNLLYGLLSPHQEEEEEGSFLMAYSASTAGGQLEM